MTLKQRIFAFVGVLLLLTSCSVDEPNVYFQQQDSDPNSKLEIAIQMAEEMIASLDGQQTRNVNREINSIQVYTLTQTRSSEPTLFYIVSYKNDQGFSLINLSDPESPVYGFSNEGTLSSNDITNDPAFSEYLTSVIPSSFGDSITWSGLNPGLKPLDPVKPSYGEVVVNPIIPRSVASWGQSYPINRYCPTITNHDGTTKNAFTGCVPLAYAIIMTHYQWPTSYGSTTFNWNNIIVDKYNDGLAKLITYLQSEDNLDVYYSEYGTGAYETNFARTFYNFGFEKPNINNNFSTYSLTENNPILVWGNRVTELEEKEGHAWVVDGKYVFHHSESYLSPGIAPYDEYYFHTIWGWNGSYNGYYKYGNVTAATPGYTESYENKLSCPDQYENFRSIGTLKKRQ